MRKTCEKKRKLRKIAGKLRKIANWKPLPPPSIVAKYDRSRTQTCKRSGIKSNVRPELFLAGTKMAPTLENSTALSRSHGCVRHQG